MSRVIWFSRSRGSLATLAASSLLASGCSWVLDGDLTGPTRISAPDASDAGGSLDRALADAVADVGGRDGSMLRDLGRVDAATADATTPDAYQTDVGQPDRGTLDSGPWDRGTGDASLPDAVPSDAVPSDAGPSDAVPLDAEPLDAVIVDAEILQDAGPAQDPATACQRACYHLTRCARGAECPGYVYGNTIDLFDQCVAACRPSGRIERIAEADCHDAIQQAEREFDDLFEACKDPDPCAAMVDAQIRCVRPDCGRLDDEAAEIRPMLIQRCHRQLNSGALNEARVRLLTVLPCFDPMVVLNNAPLTQVGREIADWCRGGIGRGTQACTDNCGRVVDCVPLNDPRSDRGLCEAHCHADWAHQGFYDCVDQQMNCNNGAGACGPMYPYPEP